MTLPPLRTGICTIGPARYPAIVGKVEGDDREIFVCGVHIDFFLSRKFPRLPSLPEAMKEHIRIDVPEDAPTI